MPDDLKNKIRSFILGYGRSGPEAERERAVLAGMSGGWAPFKESSDDQLLPIRQLSLYKDKSKLEADADMDPKEKAEKIAAIDAKLAELQKRVASLGQ